MLKIIFFFYSDKIIDYNLYVFILQFWNRTNYCATITICLILAVSPDENYTKIMEFIWSIFLTYWNRRSGYVKPCSSIKTSLNYNSWSSRHLNKKNRIKKSAKKIKYCKYCLLWRAIWIWKSWLLINLWWWSCSSMGLWWRNCSSTIRGRKSLLICSIISYNIYLFCLYSNLYLLRHLVPGGFWAEDPE